MPKKNQKKVPLHNLIKNENKNNETMNKRNTRSTTKSVQTTNRSITNDIQKSEKSAAKSTNNTNAAASNEKKHSSSKTKTSKGKTASIKRKACHLTNEEEGIKSLYSAITCRSERNKTSNDAPLFKESSHLLSRNEISNKDESNTECARHKESIMSRKDMLMKTKNTKEKIDSKNKKC